MNVYESVSDLQLKILLYVASYVDVYGHAPVQIEIQVNCKLGSTTIRRNLQQLEQLGFLVRNGKHRQMSVVIPATRKQEAA